MKGIILAGGSGTRLYPITIPTIKQLLPVYDKPMIYYPLSVLMHAGVTEILIISTPKDLPRFQELFGDGTHLGMHFEYAAQETPRGLADALLIGESFIGNEGCWLILGDNLIYGSYLPKLLEETSKQKTGATIFGYHVSDPERFGVVEFDAKGKVLSLEEKPEKPKSNYAVIGLYYYDSKASKLAKEVKPSERGELEITTLNNSYLEKGELKVQLLGRGYAWFDTGTYDSMADAANMVRVIQETQGLKIGCIEEIAYRKSYITKEQLLKLAEPLKKTSYGKYLKEMVKEPTLPHN
ncbi:glucose-1-phosphate thymidylyltransferase RfbA [Candidatus Woesearchaeota archaeon]|nr:glucose-1-phosphate thymidylyltransferase RfbA [Nanoarchaeota archaeon]MCB9370489.1 glucose-1-phosphate thymidylyltransferase RfbA [Candidatus Woesearchaeota archaeon]USN43567.1 MAG: glucose-1-phosphate thymidylyltransferase RfbA [Candidatus Woesearchaeota archaeon]